MKKRIALGVLIVLLLSIFLALWAVPKKKPMIWGITFSAQQAESLGLDPDETLTALIRDLGVRAVRLSAYWDDIESEQGVYDFSRIDRELDIAEAEGATVVLVVGRKTPRWPECHDPAWLSGESLTIQKERQLLYVRETIEHLKGRNSIGAWQVENEPFLPFGVCPNYDTDLLDQELELVRTLDPSREIIVTDSGELSFWVRAAKRADIFGTTMYRKVSNRYLGLITYPIPAAFFRVKLAFTELLVGKRPAIVIELQGEPWDLEPYQGLSIERQFVTMGPEDFAKTLEYAERTGFNVFYLWGGEWWYYLKRSGHDEHWNIVKEKIREAS